MQVFLVELDEQARLHTRVAAVLSDGRHMAAVELSGNVLTYNSEGRFAEGDIAVVMKVHPPFDVSSNLTLVTEILDSRAYGCVIGKPSTVSRQVFPHLTRSYTTFELSTAAGRSKHVSRYLSSTRRCSAPIATLHRSTCR